MHENIGPIEPAPEESGGRQWFDLSDLIRLYRRHIKLFAAIVIAFTGAAILAAYLLPTSYEGVSRVRIDPQRRAVLDDTVQSQNFQTDQARVDTEVQLMRSADIAQDVVRALELWRDPRFVLDNFDANVSSSEQRDELIRLVARKVGQGFSVRRNGNSFIVDLVYSTDDPQLAASIANAFAQAYVDASGRLQSDQAREESQYLERQMNELGGEVRSADAQIADYRARTGITQNGAGTVTDQQIGPVASAYAEAQSQAAEANGRLSAAQAQVQSGSIYAVSDVLNSTVITQLRAQRTDLLNQQADLSTRYGPNHPETQRISSQLDAIEGQIADEAGRIVSRLRADAQAANARAASLGGRLGGLRSEQAGNTRAAVTADSLQRENDANREIYERLAQQAQQTGQQAQVLQPAGTIVQFALPPTDPIFPDKKLFALAGLLCGLLLGSVVIFAIEFVRRGLRNPDEVGALGIDFLASIPLIERRDRRSLQKNGHALWDAVLIKPMSAFAEAIRSLRATVLPLDELPGAGRVVTFVSALPSEGKSHTAVSFAHICGLSGDRTIIVDCDLRRPTLVRMLQNEPGFGLVDVLSGRASLDQAIVGYPGGGLDTISIKASDMTPQDLIGSQAFAQLVGELRGRYDVVVLDTPPVLAVASARVIARLADNVVFLVKWDETPRGAVKSALKVLRKDGIHPTGLAFNMVDTRLQSSIGEDDPAYYQRAYAAYYQN